MTNLQLTIVERALVILPSVIPIPLPKVPHIRYRTTKVFHAHNTVQDFFLGGLENSKNV